MNEIFFCEFPIILEKWLLKLYKKKRYFAGCVLMVCTPKFIQTIKCVYNKISSAIHYWLDSIHAGYVTEFTVENLKSYNTTEKRVFQRTVK